MVRAVAALPIRSRRCLVLDAGGCATVRALSGLRNPGEVHVPNICSEAYDRLKASRMCAAHFGSIRSLVQSTCKDREPYGLVYLDYCCRLRAGYNHVEKSPIADLELLFSRRCCCGDGCVLALCVAADAPSRPEKFADADAELRACADATADAIISLASSHEIAARSHAARFIDAGQRMVAVVLLLHNNNGLTRHDGETPEGGMDALVAQFTALDLDVESHPAPSAASESAPSLAPGGAEHDDACAPPPPVAECTRCGVGFASRNALFRHLERCEE